MPSRIASGPAPAPTSTSRSRRACSPTSARWCRRCGRRSTRTSTRWRRWCRGRRKRARHRRLAQPDRFAARHAGPAVGIADAASGYPAAGSATGFRDRQCRQRPRAVLSEHSIDRAGRLPELGAVVAVSAARRVLQHGRQPDPADLRRRQDPRQFRTHQGAGRTSCCRSTARRWCRPLPMSTTR